MASTYISPANNVASVRRDPSGPLSVLALETSLQFLVARSQRRVQVMGQISGSI